MGAHLGLGWAAWQGRASKWARIRVGVIPYGLTTTQKDIKLWAVVMDWLLLEGCCVSSGWGWVLAVLVGCPGVVGQLVSNCIAALYIVIIAFYFPFFSFVLVNNFYFYPWVQFCFWFSASSLLGGSEWMSMWYWVLPGYTTAVLQM